MSTTPLIDLTIRDFVRDLASSDPAPGGGAAAAVAAAMGAALTAMTAALTIGRKRYADVEREMREVHLRSQQLASELLALVDADAASYTGVMDAYQLPAGTEEERSVRHDAIQATMRQATDIPLAVAEACVQVLELAAMAAEMGNRNARGDVAAGAHLAQAALLTVGRNVRLNVASLQDRDFGSAAEARVTSLLARGDDLVQRATSARARMPVPAPA